MKEQLHIFDDGVYAGPEKPTFLDFPETAIDNMSRYNPAIKKWQSACMKVENAHKVSGDHPVFTIHDENGFCIGVVTPGQLAETVLRDGKKIVTKIL